MVATTTLGPEPCSCYKSIVATIILGLEGIISGSIAATTTLNLETL